MQEILFSLILFFVFLRNHWFHHRLWGLGCISFSLIEFSHLGDLLASNTLLFNHCGRRSWNRFLLLGLLGLILLHFYRLLILFNLKRLLDNHSFLDNHLNRLLDDFLNNNLDSLFNYYFSWLILSLSFDNLLSLAGLKLNLSLNLF